MARVHPRRWFAERVNLDALRIAYGDLAALAVSLDEDASWRPPAAPGGCTDGSAAIPAVDAGT